MVDEKVAWKAEPLELPRVDWLAVYWAELMVVYLVVHLVVH